MLKTNYFQYFNLRDLPHMPQNIVGGGMNKRTIHRGGLKLMNKQGRGYENKSH